jgi:hypothetical protein
MTNSLAFELFYYVPCVIDIEKGRKRMKLQKLGGYAAIASALVFIPMLIIVLRFGSLGDPAKFMAAVTTAPFTFGAFYVLFITHFILLLISYFALYECMQNKAPWLTRVAVIAASAGTAFLIANAIVSFGNVRITYYRTVPLQDFSGFEATMNAIAGGLLLTAKHCCGWAALLMGLAILQTRFFPAILGWLSVVIGLGGIADFVLVWFHLPITNALHPLVCLTSLWIGIALLRKKQRQSAL